MNQDKNQKENIEPKEKGKNRELIVLAVLFVGYVIISSVIGRGIPCIFHEITGLKCPGCGMTHALTALVKGHIKEAFSYNALSVTMLPAIGIYLILKGFFSDKSGEVHFKWYENIFLVICLLCCILYFLVRNNII